MELNDLTIGTRIYNGGDMANCAHFGTITKVQPPGRFSAQIQITPDAESGYDGGPYWVPPCAFSPEYNGTGLTRIVTEAAYAAWRQSRLELLYGAIHAAEVNGTRRIVISGQGEADFCATTPVKDVVEHLYNVACECGYFVDRLHSDGQGNQALPVVVEGSRYVIYWHNGRLVRITKGELDCWHTDKPGLRAW